MSHQTTALDRCRVGTVVKAAGSYGQAMSGENPEELRAVHAARRELGPDYDDALLDSFVDRAEDQLRHRLAVSPPPASTPAAVARPTRRGVHVSIGPGGLLLIAATSGWGVLSTVEEALNPYQIRGLSPLVFVWIVLGLFDAAYIGAQLASRERRPRPAAPEPGPTGVGPARRPEPRTR